MPAPARVDEGYGSYQPEAERTLLNRRHQRGHSAFDPTRPQSKRKSTPEISYFRTYQKTNDSSSQNRINGGPPVEMEFACAITSLPPSDSMDVFKSSTVEK